MENRLSYRLVTVACLLALVVVVLGAYTRLTHAGLGCPDWPGCYGHMIVPRGSHQLLKARQAYPLIPVESTKAWTEMVHRYSAGTLGLLILAIAGIALWRRREAQHPLLLPIALVGLVLFQAALGMWTVTLKLLPVVVMGHLLGGLTLLALLWILRLRLGNAFQHSISTRELPYKAWAILGLVIVFVQVALGGWVSSNYAGLACIGFPQCNGVLLPQLHFQHAFNLLSQLGANYQGGLLDPTSRVTIQMVHRIGALVTATYVGGLAIWIIASTQINRLRSIALLTLLILTIQFILGILNVTKLLPLSVAVSHNAFAAILLLTMVTLVYSLTAKRELK